MADFTIGAGRFKQLDKDTSVAAAGTLSRTVRFANAPSKFTVYYAGSSITVKVYAVTLHGDVEIGSGADGGKFVTPSHVAQDIKITVTNGGVAANLASIAVVSAP